MDFKSGKPRFRKVIKNIVVMLVVLSFTISISFVTTKVTAETPPVANDLSIETDKNTPISGTLLVTESEDKALVYEIVYEPQKGSVDITDTSEGLFTYTPNEDELGEDIFKFKVNDGTIDSNTATVTIEIKELKEPEPTPVEFVYQDMAKHWARYSSGRLADKNIIVGEKIANKYYFYPDKVMNRAEFTLFLAATMYLDTSVAEESEIYFADEADIPGWVLNEAKAAKDAGLIKGSEDNGKVYFNPYEKITRVEAITILHNALNPEVNSDIEFNYADAAIVPLWAIQYIKNMEGYGLVKGYDDNTIRPFQTITKAESGEILYQLLKYNEVHK